MGRLLRAAGGAVVVLALAATYLFVLTRGWL